MGTKLISNRKKYIINIIVAIILLIISMGMVFSCSNIENSVENYKKSNSVTNYLYGDIQKSNYFLYYKVLQSKENKKVNPSDVLLDINQDNNSDDYKYEFDKEIDKFREKLYSYSENLEYYCIDKESNIFESNIKDSQVIKVLSDDTYTNDNLINRTTERLRKRYKFYVVMDFDESGYMTIRKQYGINMDLLYRGKYVNEFKPIKNVTFIYAFSNKIIDDKDVSYTLNDRYTWLYEDYSSNFIKLSLAVVLILAFVIPYNKSKEILGMKNIFKIPFEVIIIILLFLGYFIYKSSIAVIMNSIQSFFMTFLKPELDDTIFDYVVNIVNVIYWFLAYSVVFSTVTILKHIWNFGVKNYVEQNSLIYKIGNMIGKIINKKFQDIDLKDKNVGKIIIVLAINFLIMILICHTFIFTKLIAFIYTIVLFKIIMKNLDEITKNYNKLFSATHKIANGELDINVDENLGVFNPLKLELENIQNGFKNAVDEEVKSEKMKTELISNVSHDLKTPLTAIITYVDLLKDENITQEKRRMYLDTLDRKSQRLKELIENLFEVSKATSGNISLNIDNVDVVSLMKQTLLELGDKIEKSNLIMKTNFNSEKIILPLDGQRMFRVFENLIVNITKYAMVGSRVYIDIIDENNKVDIIFKNMSQSEINFNVDDIAERFVRGDKSRNTDGYGLGLAIAKSFVELHDGKFLINVDGDLFKVIITFYKK